MLKPRKSWFGGDKKDPPPNVEVPVPAVSPAAIVAAESKTKSGNRSPRAGDEKKHEDTVPREGGTILKRIQSAESAGGSNNEDGANATAPWQMQWLFSEDSVTKLEQAILNRKQAEADAAPSSLSKGHALFAIMFEDMFEVNKEHNTMKKLKRNMSFCPGTAEGELQCVFELLSILESLVPGQIECLCTPDAVSNSCIGYFYKVMLFSNPHVPVVNALGMDNLNLTLWTLRLAAMIASLRGLEFVCRGKMKLTGLTRKLDLVHDQPLILSPDVKRPEILEQSVKAMDPYYLLVLCTEVLKNQLSRISMPIMNVLFEICMGKLRKKDDLVTMDVYELVSTGVLADTRILRFIIYLMNSRIDHETSVKCTEHLHNLLLGNEENSRVILKEKDWYIWAVPMVTRVYKRGKVIYASDEKKAEEKALEDQSRANKFKLEMNIMSIMLATSLIHEEDEDQFCVYLEGLKSKLSESNNANAADIVRLAWFSTLKRVQSSLKSTLRESTQPFFVNLDSFLSFIRSFIFFDDDQNVSVHYDESDGTVPDLVLTKECVQFLKNFLNQPFFTEPSRERTKETKVVEKLAVHFAKTLEFFESANSFFTLIYAQSAADTETIQAQCSNITSHLVEEPDTLKHSKEKKVKAKKDKKVVQMIQKTLILSVMKIYSARFGGHAEVKAEAEDNSQKPSPFKRIMSNTDVLLAKDMVKKSIAPAKAPESKSSDMKTPKLASASSGSGSSTIADSRTSAAELPSHDLKLNSSKSTESAADSSTLPSSVPSSKGGFSFLAEKPRKSAIQTRR
jgi:hypothetical protein